MHTEPSAVLIAEPSPRQLFKDQAAYVTAAVVAGIYHESFTIQFYQKQPMKLGVPPWPHIRNMNVAAAIAGPLVTHARLRSTHSR